MNLPTFKNKELLTQAFTHRSFLNETKEKISSNERLEFLGDSILSFIVSEYLFEKYQGYEEGMLTTLRSLLVNTKSLADSAKALDFGSLLRLSKGEEESKGRENQSLLADSFEAFIGALYLDSGLEATKEFLSDTILKKADTYVKKNTFKDPKSMLQEHVQSQKYNSPLYKVLDEQGPPHAKTFTIGVYVHNELWGKGIGRSKQEAQESAARSALEKHPK